MIVLRSKLLRGFLNSFLLVAIGAFCSSGCSSKAPTTPDRIGTKADDDESHLPPMKGQKKPIGNRGNAPMKSAR